MGLLLRPTTCHCPVEALDDGRGGADGAGDEWLIPDETLLPMDA